MKQARIRDKLVSLNLKLLAVIVGSTIVLTVSVAIFYIQYSYGKSEANIRADLIGKGSLLVDNNGVALIGMVEDNAYSAVQQLVVSTVKNDRDIIFGIFVDRDGNVWIHAGLGSDQSDGEDDVLKASGSTLHSQDLFNPGIDAWLNTLEGANYRNLFDNDDSIIEFAAPVYSERQRVGFIRYGIDTRKTLEEIQKSRENAILFACAYTILLLGFGGGLLALGYRLTQRQADKITTPLNELMAGINAITGGDYGKPISVVSDDEVGRLADHFERMRKTIEEHTGQLEQKVRERTEQLEVAQQEALKNAHKAGMADVATGTLHNVNNILNSALTSAHNIKESIYESQIQGLHKANTLLKEMMEPLLTQQPKGALLMEYYLSLGNSLEEENNLTKTHIERLSEKLLLVSDVISAQQSYAGRPTGMKESLDLNDIIEDALILNSGLFSKYAIPIQKRYNVLPKVTVQKNKLMQILMNLIVNAKDAMLGTPVEERKLMITLEQEENHAQLKVKDTGCGILPENIKKIFSQNFTTKADGHGFGLHSCANYMTEMGGKIWVESEGKNKGATFVLEFPLD